MGLPRDFVVLDTETTGMPPGGRLVEIGAVRVRGATVTGRFERLIFPECPIPPEVAAIHGITDAMVAEAPPAAEVLPEFFAWAGEAALVAHNVRFDAAVLASECARAGMLPPSNPTYCTLRAARSLLKRPSHSLEALVRDLGLPSAPHHRALADAEHALNLLWRVQEVAGTRFRWTALGSGRPLSEHTPDPVEFRSRDEVLREASQVGEAVDLRYRFSSGRIGSLLVTPRFFYRRGSRAWMEAVCHEAGFLKTYRLDRVVGARPSPETAPAEVRRPVA